jgi:hypothetical protein
MLSKVKQPLQYLSGSIYDAEGNLLANMYRESDCVIIPVCRDELAKELVRCFNLAHPQQITQEQLEEKVKAIQKGGENVSVNDLDNEDLFALLAWEMWKDGMDWDQGISDIAAGKSITREDATFNLINIFGY